MSYRVEFTLEASTDLESLTSTIQERVLRKIKWMSENFAGISHQGLSANLSSFFKLRVGDYRVIYSSNTEAKSITIHRVGHRREIYD
jgi:mRNA interferase RelE/StbE